MATHAEILRRVAVATVRDAQAAQQMADDRPSEDNLRAAFRACLLAARSLRRASEHYPDEEDAMIERSILLDEIAIGLKRRLVRLVEPRA